MKHTKSIAISSLCGITLFLVTLVLLHILRPNQSILSSFVSQYAVGNYGWLLTIGFVLFGTAVLLLLVALLLNLKATRTSIVTTAVWCAGLFVIAIFKTDLAGAPPTPQGLIHGISALVTFINIGISMIAWGLVFSRFQRWNRMAKLSKFFGVMSLALFVFFLLSPVWVRGLLERTLIVWDTAWLVLINRALFRNLPDMAT